MSAARPGECRRAAPRAPKPSMPRKASFDRINFEIEREVAQHCHHSAAHIAVERVVARPHDDAGSLKPIPMKVPRRTHGRAPWPRCCSDHAAVLARQHDDRAAAQLRLKHAFARDLEIVAVDEGERAHDDSMRMPRVMTPHTSSVCSSVSYRSGKAGFSACSHTAPSLIR